MKRELAIGLAALYLLSDPAAVPVQAGGCPVEWVEECEQFCSSLPDGPRAYYDDCYGLDPFRLVGCLCYGEQPGGGEGTGGHSCAGMGGLPCSQCC